MNPFNKDRPAFIPFLVVGDPDLSTSAKAIDILIEEGADCIELGVPFSDAMADGPVIQFASEKAARHTSLNQVLGFVTGVLQKHPGFPFVLFTYLNPILKMGIETFARRAQDAGVYAVLVVDLPPEEADEYISVMKTHGVGTVFLASPTTSAERFPKIADASTAFIYYVSRAGVTGVQEQVSKSLSKELSVLRQATKKSIAVGFGISNGAQAHEVSLIADAVVVGSAFVKVISDLESVRRLAREIRGKI